MDNFEVLWILLWLNFPFVVRMYKTVFVLTPYQFLSLLAGAAIKAVDHLALTSALSPLFDHTITFLICTHPPSLLQLLKKYTSFLIFLFHFSFVLLFNFYFSMSFRFFYFTYCLNSMYCSLSMLTWIHFPIQTQLLAFSNILYMYMFVM